MRLYLLILSTVLALLSASSVLSADSPVLVLDDSSSEVDISASLAIAQDPAQEWDLEQARARLAESGEPWDKPGIPVFGFSHAAFWASVTVRSEFPEDRDWLVKLNFPTLDRFDFWYQDASGAWQQKTAGDTFPFSNRDVDHHKIMFSFPLPAGTTRTLYFRMQTEGSMQFPLTLLDAEHQQSSKQSELLGYGLYFGMLVIIAFCSAFMWLYTRDFTYLMFACFLIAGGLYSFSFHGLSYQYLWPSSPGWANISIPVFIGLAGAVGMQFAREFLAVASIDRRLDLAILTMVRVSLVLAASALVLPYMLLSRLMLILVIILLGLLSTAAWLGWKRGDHAANYFSAGWIVLVLSVVLELLQRSGVNIPPLLSYHGIQLGSVAAVLILSLGLCDRVRQIIEQYKTVQDDMLRANQQKIEVLQKADSVKEEFIANVSHELRTPLTGIIGLSEIMLEKRAEEFSDSDRETLTMIKVSGQRLSSLVNDIIDFSAIKNGRLELHVTTVDLKQICTMVARMSRALIGTKKIELVESYPAGQVVVNGDEDRLQQILFNLVSNAIKFTLQGSVMLKIEIIDIDARVSVQDTGIGISESEQRKIFNRFYQVDSAGSRQEGGTGLGLAISQKLVELHGTEIILRSKPGAGSLFYFDLPVVKNGVLKRSDERDRKVRHEGLQQREIMRQMTSSLPTRRKADTLTLETPQPPRVSGKGRRVLVVDDEYLNLRIVQEHLSADYELSVALSGPEALELMETEKPDLIIMDLMMPVMTGFELCERIRGRYRLDELPIIILTAKNRVEDLVKGLGAGANDYITKPFSKEELKVRVRKQFELLELMEMQEEHQRLRWQLEQYQENEQRLHERESRLARMLDVTGEAMVCVDESGRIVYINLPAQQLFDVDEQEFQDNPVNLLSERIRPMSDALAESISFPFDEAKISTSGNPQFLEFTLAAADTDAAGAAISFCILPLNLDQEFYLLVFSARTGPDTDLSLSETALPQIIDELNKNVERAQRLREYLNQMTPEALQQHQHLFSDLENVDRILQHMSDAIPTADDELQYREALVKLMQDCHYYWQKVTGESIIELAEKSRIWSVSIDNGRLRTRSMNRYLALDKLPDNPRWRQVARTAYFVLSKVSHDEEAKRALEKSVTRLQEIVEARALN